MLAGISRTSGLEFRDLGQAFRDVAGKFWVFGTEERIRAIASASSLLFSSLVTYKADHNTGLGLKVWDFGVVGFGFWDSEFYSCG